MRKEVVSILLFVLLFTSVVLTTITNNVYGKDNDEDELEEEERERNEAGDHWLGGITPNESPTADKESDLSYRELCVYNGGQWNKGDCKFNDDEDEDEYQNKLKVYHGIDEETLKDKIESGEFAD